MRRSVSLAALALALVTSVTPHPVAAQPVPDLLVAPQASSAAARRGGGPARRSRKARVDGTALNSSALRLRLFDDRHLTINRRRFSRPGTDKIVWVGEGENGAQAVLTMVRGVLTGTVFADDQTFEITLEPDGQYAVTELDPGAFPTDDPVADDFQPDGANADSGAGAAPGVVGEAAAGAPVTIDVMIVWTPAAEAAGGGRAAMESLALSSVASANLVYANSGTRAQLNLVYAAAVPYAETPSSILTDLNAIRSSTDGSIDQVHTLRAQYGADLVTLIGEGYRGAGACGIGGLMTTVSTSFASSAFSVVDRTCAVGNLSYVHELGHNQGLHHDPANASGMPSQPYAYGYQDPSGAFRTVMSYGGAVRLPIFSSAILQHNGLPTGTASQDNARAINDNIATVAAFRASTSPVPPTCTYAVSATSLAYAATGGTQSVAVTAPTGCSWSTAPDAAASWVSLSPASGSGNGAVTVTAAANSGAARSATVTIAGRAIAVSEAAAAVPVVPAGGNVAAASAGAVASASTTYSGGYSPARAINGDRKGVNWGTGGGWNDAHSGHLPRLAAGRLRRAQDDQRSPRLQRPGRLRSAGRADRDADRSRCTASPASPCSTGTARSG